MKQSLHDIDDVFGFVGDLVDRHFRSRVCSRLPRSEWVAQGLLELYELDRREGADARSFKALARKAIPNALRNWHKREARELQHESLEALMEQGVIA